MPKSEARIAGGNRLSRSVTWNYVGYFCQIAINLGLTWFLTRRLAVAEYGLFVFVMALTNALYMLDMGISSVLVLAFVGATSKQDKDELNDLIGTSFFALATLGALGVAIFSILAVLLPGPFAIPADLVSKARILFVVGALMIQIALPTMAIEMAYQASNRFDRLNQTQLVSAALQLVFSVLVLYAGFGVVALAWVQLGSIALRSLVLAWDLPRAVPGAGLSLRRFRIGLLRPLLTMSRWAFLNNVGATALDFLIWTLLGTLGSMREAALFGLAGRLPKQLWNLIDKGANVALPVLSEAAAQNDIAALKMTYLRTLQLLFGAALPFVILGCFSAKPILVVWAGTQYAAAGPVMQLLLLGVVSHANGYASSQLMFACRRVKLASCIALSEYLIILALALPLFRHYGIVGLAAGMMAVQLAVNFGWLTWAACDLSHTSFSTLLSTITDGLALPAAVLVGEIIAISRLDSRLSPSGILAVSIASGCVYLGIWGSRTALPLYRAQAATMA
jgi:O-antigen/teichoic acid export membrane protein